MKLYCCGSEYVYPWIQGTSVTRDVLEYTRVLQLRRVVFSWDELDIPTCLQVCSGSRPVICTILQKYYVVLVCKTTVTSEQVQDE